MNTIRLIFSSLLILMVCTGFLCEDEDSPTVAAGGGGSSGLSASSTTLTMLPGQESTVIISTGTSPYSLVQNSNPAAAEVSLMGVQLTIKALSVGSSSVVVQDASSPAKSVTIQVNVVSSIALPSAGSLSFSAPIGNFSANGVLTLSSEDNPVGEGAGALQEFGGTAVVAYKVYSATKVDLFEADFIYSTSLKTGIYSYPSGGNKVQILYVKDVNPQDTTVRPKFFVFTVASAEIKTMTSTSVSGTFSGTATNFYNSTEQTTVTNGTFNVPIKIVGGNEERPLSGSPVNALEVLKRRWMNQR